MTPDVALKVLGVVVVVALAFLVLRRLQAPKARTTRLAITVWAAFGPYDTADNAEDGLYRASRAAFGQEGITEHAEWLQGHIQNFHDWQAEGRFQEAQKMMRAALRACWFPRSSSTTSRRLGTADRKATSMTTCATTSIAPGRCMTNASPHP